MLKPMNPGLQPAFLWGGCRFEVQKGILVKYVLANFQLSARSSLHVIRCVQSEIMSQMSLELHCTCIFNLNTQTILLSTIARKTEAATIKIVNAPTSPLQDIHRNTFHPQLIDGAFRDNNQLTKSPQTIQSSMCLS